MLVHTDITRLTRLNRASYRKYSNVTSLNIFTNYFSSNLKNQIELHHQYHNTTCQFICDPLIKSENFCYCDNDIETLKEYMCDTYDVGCLSKLNLNYDKLCVGYKCENGKCLKNNVRCNSLNDCGDLSDEEKCKRMCSVDKHLCEGKCIPKSTICPDLSYEYPSKHIPGVFRKRSRIDDFYDNF
ncbi:Low-density lipoprotein receptor-related protein 6 [Thelohanellus kitauei]|uniref:Low-density lipoprotein receptor-related protein 6 n=1 Tax=Thelohanellus kitauei TaxID=669202 RepID=A0A0C2MPH3_THEKT|nr:Low-density lipoprotein receptor-related protein 6 [Thelohanellus kitauei]